MCNEPMDIYEVRRINLKRLVGDEKGAIKEFADRIGKDRSQISQLLGDKNMGYSIARQIEARMGLEPNWMDEHHIREEPAGYDSDAALREVLSQEEIEIIRLHRKLSKKQRDAWRQVGDALTEPDDKDRENNCA